MTSYEVPSPILNSPFEEPKKHWLIEPNKPTKGFDPLADVKRQAAERWTSAVTAEGSYGVWRYVMVKNPAEIRKVIDQS